LASALHFWDRMRTTPMLRLAFGLAALVAALAVPEVGGAGTCASTCGAEKRTCQLATVTAFRTCRADVRASRATGLSRRDAIRNCRGAMRQAHQMCVASLRDCLDGCAMPPASSCQAACGIQGRTCVQGVISAARACLGACSPGAGRLQCVEGCTTQAQFGLAGCRSTRQSCLGACVGSPGGAFLN